eukprot:PLAT8281.1.p1 GENE.PLAT8281.1~~PLAT8281.1.p1  ORF type:complete len:518 (+),score=254.10 PLAT8281.1:46-1554(+)
MGVAQRIQERMRTWTIKRQLMCTFESLSAFSLILMFILVNINLAVLGGQTELLARTSLETQITHNMELTAQSSAEQIGEVLKRPQLGVSTLGNVLHQLAGSNAFASRTSHYDQSALDLNYDNRRLVADGQMVAIDYSTWFLPGDSLTEPTLSGQTANELAMSAHLDPFLRNVFLSNSNIAALHVVFDSSGLMRSFPGVRKTNHDSRKTRPWYTQAEDLQPGQVVFTAPYQDLSSSKYMITASTMVYSDSNGDHPLAVIAADVLIDNIQSFLGNLTFLDSGFAALADRTEKIVISHPRFAELKAEGQDLTLEAVERGLTDDESVSGKVLADTAGVESYSNEGEPTFIAHAPLPDAPYAVLVFVPEEEAFETLPELQAHIGQTTLEISMISFVIVMLSAVLVVVMVRVLARRIASPIERMVDISNRIVNGAAEKDFTKDLVDEHVEELTKFEALPGTPPEEVDEMQGLVTAFLDLISGLKNDSERKKRAPKYPDNPYYRKRLPF